MTPQQNQAEIANICARATALVDATCKQPLRATVDTVQLYAPGVRAGVPQNGWQPSTLIMTRWPVLSVLSVQVAQNSFPRTWSAVPAGMYEPRYPVVGMYGSTAPPATGEGGQAVTLAAGWLNWAWGREGYVVQVQYINGWPHTALTAQAVPVTSPAVQTVQVDDCTGWAITSQVGGITGATGTLFDAGAQEVIHVASASATAGPGTLTLASPLTFTHQPGALVTTLPQSVTWAAILFAVDVALERGATSTTIPDIPGREVAVEAGVAGKASTPSGWAECILKGTFDRII